MGLGHGREEMNIRPRTIADEKYQKIVHAVEQCSFPDYMFAVRQIEGGALIHGIYWEPDAVEKKLPQAQQTREWFVPLSVSKSEVVRTCFKLVMASYEHRVREWFTYKGKAIHQPHYDVDQLAAMNEESAN
jgi:hypothetical protein